MLYEVITPLLSGGVMMEQAVIVDALRTPMGRARQGIFRQVRAEALSGHLIRITSYNVCYTKLLRSLSSKFVVSHPNCSKFAL